MVCSSSIHAVFCLLAALAAVHATSVPTPRKFVVDVPEEVLTDLRARLDRAQSRWPDELADANDWSYGANLAYMKEFVQYWRNEYDWRKHEARINSFPQFTLDIDGINIHFIHALSTRPDAIPLLLVHGWPGSIAEFLKIIPMLTEPTDRESQAFHVVAPSIPGFGFSGKPTARGHCPATIAKQFVKLMAALGYDRYGAQGGDWGSLISSEVAHFDSAHVLGLHLNMNPTLPPLRKGFFPLLKTLFTFLAPSWMLSKLEQTRLSDASSWVLIESGYMHVQATKPQSLGFALADSPVGLAAWLVEKFHRWTDNSGNVEEAVTKDELLTNIMVYWITNTITSSMRIYYESFRSDEVMNKFDEAVIRVPMAYADFPKETGLPIRRWMEYNYANIKQWDRMANGGHFAALEQPELLSESIARFFKILQIESSRKPAKAEL